MKRKPPRAKFLSEKGQAGGLSRRHAAHRSPLQPSNTLLARNDRTSQPQEGDESARTPTRCEKRPKHRTGRREKPSGSSVVQACRPPRPASPRVNATSAVLASRRLLRMPTVGSTLHPYSPARGIASGGKTADGMVDPVSAASSSERHARSWPTKTAAHAAARREVPPQV